MTAWLSLFLLLARPPAQAAIIAGRDCGGLDLICDGSAVCGAAETCGNGDTLQGTFSNVRLFSIGVGTTVFVYQGTPLVIYASTVSIFGTINGVGGGTVGGSGGASGAAGVRSSGSTGLGAGPSGAGAGGALYKGGGGGGYGNSGGQGGGSGGGAGGAAYFSSGTVTLPISRDDAAMGSGGGGGGGGDNANASSGAGGPGGASVYLEASSITFAGNGSVLADGAAGASATDLNVGNHPGGGGGGGGGGIVIRAPGYAWFGGSGSLSAKGGNGGHVQTPAGGTLNPGGGGAGGRIKLYYVSPSSFSIILSTAIGFVGGKGGGTGNFESTGTVNNGSTGTISFGIIASSPSNVAVGPVFITSITWSWNSSLAWGDGVSGIREFHVHASSSLPPLPSPQKSVLSTVSSVIEEGLLPNTTYSRFITAFTDWGDSLPSLVVTTHTLANTPGPPSGVSTFSAVQQTGLTFNWGPGSPPNHSSTTYEVWLSTVSDFSAAAQTGFVVGLSSSPGGLTPETVYYLRVRAVNSDGIRTPFTQTFSIATSTVPPQPPGAPRADSPFSYDGTATFRWSAASSASGIQYYVFEIGTIPGTADFASVNVGNVLSYTVAGLATGRTYYARVRAQSNADLSSSFSDSSPPVSVFVPAQAARISKPYNWPNPFDPQTGPTNIGFSLEEAADVTLRIYTLQGDLVHEESRRVDAAGNQVWTWNGSNDAGRRVAPGGYIAQIRKAYAGRSDTQRFKIAVLY